MPFMRQPPAPKGDLDALWKLLGIQMAQLPAQRQGLGGAPSGGTTAIVWQDYTPHPRMLLSFGHSLPRPPHASAAIALHRRTAALLLRLFFLQPARHPLPSVVHRLPLSQFLLRRQVISPDGGCSGGTSAYSGAVSRLSSNCVITMRFRRARPAVDSSSALETSAPAASFSSSLFCSLEGSPSLDQPHCQNGGHI